MRKVIYHSENETVELFSDNHEGYKVVVLSDKELTESEVLKIANMKSAKIKSSATYAYSLEQDEEPETYNYYLSE